jgi:large subunit ribosomal protein L10
MNRKQKQTVVENLQTAFSSAEIAIVAQNSGLDANQTGILRQKVRSVEGKALVAKNTLAKLGVKGSAYESLTGLLKGPTMLLYTDSDPVALAKIVVDFAKDNKSLQLKGGAIGTKVLDLQTLNALAALPTLNQLHGKLIGIIQAPATKVAGVISAPARNVIGVLQAYSEK